jgi:TPR repeat protein
MKPLLQTMTGLFVALAVQTFATAAAADIDTGLKALDTGDVATAASEFQSSFEAGEGDGAFYLGRLFEFGLGTEADMSRAANLYAAGAEIGSVLAMNRLGLLYLEGTTLLRDYPEAARLFCASADAGDVTGQLNCALMLNDGRGIDADATKAVAYFEKAAGQDNIAAKNLLGQILATGDGVPADPERARALFIQTATEGNAMGMFELAKSYVAEDDLVQAYAYANLATVRQHEEARALRDNLETQMTFDQINAGQGQAKAWTASRIAEQAATQSE